MSGKYDDIIDLPHPISKKHPQMPAVDRAAQFSPFAALTGYDAAIKETGRLTDTKMEPEGAALEALNKALRLLAAPEGSGSEVTITHFVSDDRKEGGAYRTTAGRVKKVDPYNRCVVLEDGRCIFISNIYEITGDLLGHAESSIE